MLTKLFYDIANAELLCSEFVCLVLRSTPVQKSRIVIGLPISQNFDTHLCLRFWIQFKDQTPLNSKYLAGPECNDLNMFSAETACY